MILYLENPKHNTRKLLELINEFGKVIGCKINMQKSVAFLYTINERSEREIKDIITFTFIPKTIKYLGIKLPKEVKGSVQNSPQIHCDPYRITNDIYNYNLQLQIQNTITIYNYHFSQN